MLKNINIKIKVLATILVSLFLLALAVGFISVNKSKDALMEKSYDSLTSSRDMKSEQIKNFFAQKIASINMLVKTKDVNELAYDMDSIEGQMNINAEGKFPVDEQLVKDITSPHEAFFGTYMKENAYENIYLINMETGQVVYSANKKSDYGANLKPGN